LIAASGYREFPPRLPEQAIFYPVLNEEYATQMARDWNATNSGIGIVTKFLIKTASLSNFEIHTVGARIHQEYWIPSDELPDFNRNIVGLIEVISEFRAKQKRPRLRRRRSFVQ
jgi:hypothetical protein